VRKKSAKDRGLWEAGKAIQGQPEIKMEAQGRGKLSIFMFGAP
jgi:hypothetical protein